MILRALSHTAPEPKITDTEAIRGPVGPAGSRSAATEGYEGFLDGGGEDGINQSEPSVQDYVPNIAQPFQTFPQTLVNPTHEQGFGRPPGFQFGWMHHYEPKEKYHYRTSRARNMAVGRPEPMVSAQHPPGTGRYQRIARAFTHNRQGTSLPQPVNVPYVSGGNPNNLATMPEPV